jgi:predicted kinase
VTDTTDGGPGVAHDARPVAYVLVGLPGSGKSTWAAAHPEGLAVASTDEYIEAYAAQHGLSYAEAFRQYHPQAKLLLKQRLNELIAARRPFIWDQTNITARKRRAVYNKLHATHRVVFVCFCVPVEVCIERAQRRPRQAGEVINPALIRLWSSMLTFPEPGEPCDGIIPVIHPDFRRR